MRILVTLLILVVVGCGGTEAPQSDMSGWNTLGEVSDGLSEVTIFWTVNEETGDRVYVLVGNRKGSVFVIPPRESSEK